MAPILCPRPTTWSSGSLAACLAIVKSLPDYHLPWRLAAGLLLIFDCARRLTDGLHGLIALAVATCSFLPYYGYEARSYALYFMLAALALWVWFCTRDDKKSSAIFFGVVMCLGVTMHYYFVLCLAPFAIWEILRGKRGQLASPKLIAGFVGPLFLLRCCRQLSCHSPTNFRPASGIVHRSANSGQSIPQLFPDGLFLLVLIVIWVVLADSDKKNVALAAHAIWREPSAGCSSAFH